MGRKSKNNLETKIKVVEEYLAGKSSKKQLAKENKIGQTTIRRWITNYKSMGADGLDTKPKNATYSRELKKMVVDEYLTGKTSLSEIQEKYKIRSDHQIRNWIKWYNDHGDFKQPNTGGTIYMEKGRKTTLDERIEIVSHCISNNRDYGKTIEKYGVSYQQIYGWVKKYEKDGADGLIDRRGKHKDEATMSEVEKLQAQLKLQKAENLRLQMENELLKKLEALERGRNAD